VKYVFFLGGRDAEMHEIAAILMENHQKYFDKGLTWGACLSDYRSELRSIEQNETPVLIELTMDISYPQDSIIIDHHNQNAGKDQPTAIEQVADLLGIELNRWQQLIAANDRGYIPGLKTAGATAEEIEAIRKLDRRCQGVSEDEEIKAEAICRGFKSRGKLDVLRIPFSHTSPITDRLFGQYENLLILTAVDINFYGAGKIVQILADAYPDSWSGGDLPDRGFWGTEKKIKFKEIESKIRSYLC